MEFILEFIFDLVLESSMEIAKDKKIKKWIRYPLAFVLFLFIIAVIGTIFFVGIMFIFDEEINIKLAGILFIIFDIILIISAIKKIMNEKNKYNKSLNKEKYKDM